MFELIGSLPWIAYSLKKGEWVSWNCFFYQSDHIPEPHSLKQRPRSEHNWEKKSWGDQGKYFNACYQSEQIPTLLPTPPPPALHFPSSFPYHLQQSPPPVHLNDTLPHKVNFCAVLSGIQWSSLLLLAAPFGWSSCSLNNSFQSICCYWWIMSENEDLRNVPQTPAKTSCFRASCQARSKQVRGNQVSIRWALSAGISSESH